MIDTTKKVTPGDCNLDGNVGTGDNALLSGNWGKTGGGTPVAPQAVVDYHARAMLPAQGRFCQRDPADFADAYNLYEYCNTRPTVLTDPTGKSALLGELAGDAMTAYGYYQTAQGVGNSILGLAQNLNEGMAWRAAAYECLVDIAVDGIESYAFGRALGIIGRISSGIGNYPDRTWAGSSQGEHRKRPEKLRSGWVLVRKEHRL